MARNVSWSQYIRRILPSLTTDAQPYRKPISLSRSEQTSPWPAKSQTMASKDSQSPAQPQSQSYLAKLSPWARSPALQPSKGKDGEPEHTPLVKQQQGADHVVSQRHRLSLRKYPRDCPPLRPQWFHAVDSPKRRPNPAGDKVEQVLPKPKKYAAFSVRDSKRIEGAYGKLAEEEQEKRRGGEQDVEGGDVGTQKAGKDKKRAGVEEGGEGRVKVPVNEDYLFDVDVERRELGPAYWHGPVYDVRRGTWFYQEGATQRPCDENLAEQLEDGYIKVKPWKFPQAASSSEKARSSSQPRTRPTSWTPGQPSEKVALSVPMTPKGSNPDLRRQAMDEPKPPPDQAKAIETGQAQQPENTYRLFGSHMNSVVTYQDANTAWLLTDDFMARMNYTMYQRFAGGGHFGGIKMTRGYQPPAKKPADPKDDKTTASDGKQAPNRSDKKDKEAKTDDEENEEHEEHEEHEEQRQSVSEIRRAKLERHMSSLLEDTGTPENKAKQEAELLKRDEREMEEDYRETENEDPDREIEHLILVTHGIGQRLGLRIDAVNFVHDVNTLRKTIKAVYADSPDLRALNAELGESQKLNSRIQVLPICWRHLLDFPKQSLRHNRREREHDLGDTSLSDEDLDYPSLEDISVEGVPGVRNLITDLALDILLYQSPAYKDHISRIVLEECNRIYGLFVQRNPGFSGKVSFVGHSLGSAVMFDLLCRQGKGMEGGGGGHKRREKHPLKLDFEVEDFYALGSPIGLFQMLKGRTVQARESANPRHRDVSGSMDDPMLDVASSKPTGSTALPSTRTRGLSNATAMPASDIQVSSPKCAQLFNIFHPTDPISYRMEPLIAPTMSSLKPQPLPYTKRGIFGAPMGQGLTGIGARVSQSVSSMWSSMASSLLTRGLGYSGTETPTAAQLQAGSAQQQQHQQQKDGSKAGAASSASMATGPSAQTAPNLSAVEAAQQAKAAQNQSTLAAQTLSARRTGTSPPTLIDAELETLYSGFQKARSPDPDAGATSTDWREAEERGKRLRWEEEKVRRLNANGRVDYAIQEGAFDINLIAAIASHLSYWSDEDVSHFVVSQLLSKRRRTEGLDGAGSGEDEGRR